MRDRRWVTPRRVAPLVMAGALLAGACRAPVDSSPRTLRAAQLPPALRQETPTTTTTVLSTGESVEVTVYFIGHDAFTGTDRLVPVTRSVSPPATVEKVVQKLFAGPTGQERLGGLRTAISLDTAVLDALVEARIATVNVSKAFAFGPPLEQTIALAQVVFTAVDVGGVTGVIFAQNGKRLEVPDGLGRSVSVPLGKGAYPLVTPR